MVAIIVEGMADEVVDDLQFVLWVEVQEEVVEAMT